MPACRTARRFAVALNLLLLLGGLPLTVQAADISPWFVRAWQTDDGLPDNNVTDVAQTAAGYLWVSTQGGLALFDGVRFREVILPTPSQRTRPLLRSMLLGQGGEVWLALEGGIAMSLSPSRTNVYTSKDGLPNFRPIDMAQDEKGNIWIGYADGSACRIADGKVHRYTASQGLSGVGRCQLASDNKGQIWFAKAGHLITFRDENFEAVAELPDRNVRLAAARSGGMWLLAGTQVLKFVEGKSLEPVAAINSPEPGLTPSSIYEDHSGSVWVGTQAGGLFHISGTNVASVPNIYPDILDISEDREGNIWVGTAGGGLNRVSRRLMELENTSTGMPFASARSLGEDAAGNIWAAAQNGGLARCEQGVWRDISTNNNWLGVRATCVTGDGRDGVWVGTAHGGLRHWVAGQVNVLGRGDGLGGEIIRALLIDRATNLWIALEAPSGLQCFHDGKINSIPLPPSARTIRAMVEDRAGTIWLGTVDGFLFRVENGQLVDATRGTLPHPKPIRCLYADADGDLWIGYAGAGVGRIHEGKFSSLSTGRGLHDAYICSMIQDDGGGFWFCSDHGIFQVRKRELVEALDGKIDGIHSVLYGRDESLPNLQANYGYSPGCLRSSDGRIWFPTRAGLVVINPHITAPDHLVPPVVVEAIKVDGQLTPLTPDGQTILPPGHRRIDLEFTALSFIAPENISFRCKLEGWDDNWVNVPRGQRSISYSRLPAGGYRFRVTACNNAGIWNETGASLAFAVEPFLWQKWWFRVAALAILLGSVALLVRFYLRRKYQARLKILEQQAALQNERARIAKDLHDELGASLTQISLLGKLTQHDLAEPAKAGAHVEKMASLARQGVKSVDEIVWAVTPRNDNLSQLLDYAGQHAVDFLEATGIRCRIDFPEKIPPLELPANLRHGLFMVIKEALHNAVKHSGATEISITARLEENLLRLSVADNGRGFSSTPDGPLADGLRNMKQRITDFGGQCEIESAPGTGTNVRVELRLP